MIFYCDACHQTYELNRTGVSCIYCGACACRSCEPPAEEKEPIQEG